MAVGVLPLLLRLYRGVTPFLMPVAAAVTCARLASGREEKGRLKERFGYGGVARPEGHLLWIHAASVGEALSVLPLIARLRRERDDIGVLLTTVTVSASQMMVGRLPAGVVHQYACLDIPAYVRRFLEHWRPCAALRLESELWPNQLWETARRGIPSLLGNARLSPRSQRRWRRAPSLVRALMSCFTLRLAQDHVQAVRLRCLGVKVAVGGNLKLASPPLPCPAHMRGEPARLKAALRGAPLWLAASTHEGEEEAAALAHKTLARRWPRLVTVIAPRHPRRGVEVAARLASFPSMAAVKVARRGQGAQLPVAGGVYIADSLGELGVWYRLAAVVFMGGSLVARGGQNPLEAARLGCALLWGTHMYNFPAVATDLEERGAALKVADAEELAAQLGALFSDKKRTARMAAAGLCYTAQGGEVLETYMRALSSLLPPAVAA